MEILLEEKKRKMHIMIDALDNERIDRAIALLELTLIKVNRDSVKYHSGEEARKISKAKIESWWNK